MRSSCSKVLWSKRKLIRIFARRPKCLSDKDACKDGTFAERGKGSIRERYTVPICRSTVLFFRLLNIFRSRKSSVILRILELCRACSPFAIDNLDSCEATITWKLLHVRKIERTTSKYNHQSRWIRLLSVMIYAEQRYQLRT